MHTGARVSLGHGAVVEDDVLTGIRAVVLDGAHVGNGSIVAAGAIVTEGMDVPGKLKRATNDKDLARIMTDSDFNLYHRLKLANSPPFDHPDHSRCLYQGE